MRSRKPLPRGARPGLARRSRKAKSSTASKREGPTHSDQVLLSRSPAETDRLGRILGRCAQGGEVVALFGDLGTGKTALVRGLAAGLGASPTKVSSPTFVLIHEYHGRLPLAHADLYRIQSESELPHLGLSEYLAGPGVVAIEWAEKARTELPQDRLEVHLEHRTDRTRRVCLKALGPRSKSLLSMTKQQWSQRSQVPGPFQRSTRKTGMSRRSRSSR